MADPPKETNRMSEFVFSVPQSAKVIWGQSGLIGLAHEILIKLYICTKTSNATTQLPA